MKLIFSISQIIIQLLQIKSSIELNFSKEKIHIIVIDKSINVNKVRSIGLHCERNHHQRRRRLRQILKRQHRDNTNKYIRINQINYCHCRKVNVKTKRLLKQTLIRPINSLIIK